MSATKRNSRGRTYARPRRGTSLPCTGEQAGRAPVVCDPPNHLVEVIFTELRRSGIPASRIGPSPGACSWPGGGAGAPAQPITVGIQAGADAIILVIDRSMVESLFGEHGGGRVGLRSLVRAAKARSCGNRLCERMTGAAVAIGARRLLILCDAGRASVAERTRAIRWVREAAHQIGYECSINGLRGLGTSYLILVADAEPGMAARSVVDWCRSGEVR